MTHDGAPRTLLVTGISTLYSPAGSSAPLRGDELARVDVVRDAAVYAEDGIIEWVGAESELPAEWTRDGVDLHHDAAGTIALPGFVDCHTHPAWVGGRAEEFELRSVGAAYEEIHAAGGGINNSMARVARCSDDELEAATGAHLAATLARGTTTVEGKSGYGATVQDELRLLTALARAGKRHAADVHATVLAAHTVPSSFDGTSADFVEAVSIPTLHEAARHGLATAADIFIERGSFSAADARAYLGVAQQLGLHRRIHGDQFSDQGAIDVALEVGARSVDHLEASTPERLRQLAASQTAGVLLPVSSTFLRREYADGRAFVDAGGIAVVATDYNPGSAHSPSMPLAISLACMGCGLRAAEALAAATINAAWVLGIDHLAGRLAPGYRADIVLCDLPDLSWLGYWFEGTANVSTVIAGGQRVATHPSHAATV